MFHKLEENANHLRGNFGFVWTFQNVERRDDGVRRTKIREGWGDLKRKRQSKF